MLRRLASHLSDEFAGLGLLYGVMRYRHRPPQLGSASGADAAALLSGDPATVFGAAPAGANPALSAVPPPVVEADRVPGCDRAFDFAFPSTEVTEFALNNEVRGRLWRAERVEGPRRVVLAIDGVMQASFGNMRAFARTCCPAGIDVATIDLPFNHRRTPEGFRPGQLILGGDLPHLLSVLRQAVRDAATAYRGLAESGEYPGGVGLAGISFGGWTVLQTAALLGSVWRDEVPNGPRWVCGVCPAADLLLALTDGGAIVRAARRNLRLGSAALAELAPVAASIRPAAFPRPVPRDPADGDPSDPAGGGPNRVMLHAGLYDRFVPNAAIERLAAAWDAELSWHRTGHMGLAAAPPYLRAVAEPWTNEALWR
ncbi:alpha/beta hydrolase family protein [Alienimonas californiensis]|uniref:Alpha/beta hydrolase family protein n=1 Tax=Alienimonas californiensis TaxID=2527989 RepID=A0A517P3P4_9PLAN|nr:hypothetical protein [Alienimonas californiensis]QDT13983.1 Alpha/beta hydrolase family protein [Alienimonas californiensis]